MGLPCQLFFDYVWGDDWPPRRRCFCWNANLLCTCLAVCLYPSDRAARTIKPIDAKLIWAHRWMADNLRDLWRVITTMTSTKQETLSKMERARTKLAEIMVFLQWSHVMKVNGVQCSFASQRYSKYLNLCSTDESQSYKFGIDMRASSRGSNLSTLPFPAQTIEEGRRCRWGERRGNPSMLAFLNLFSISKAGLQFQQPPRLNNISLNGIQGAQESKKREK